MSNHDVVVVGAGPYGLSAAAYLKTIPGLSVRVFGEPMAFWKRNMPSGMFLRSPLCASHIDDPAGKLRFDAYSAKHGRQLPAPIPLSDFVSYGCWYQEQAVPDLDRRTIRNIRQTNGGFEVSTEDGEPMAAKRVVVAVGPAAFKWRPPEFSHLPTDLASHSMDHSDLSRFRGKRVVIVGAGQSAIENAALLYENGADVELLVRKPEVHWLRWKGKLHRYPGLGQLLYSPRDVGPAGVSQLIARPDLFRKFPRRFQDWATQRALNPAGSLWLVERVKGMKIRTSTWITGATESFGQLRLQLNDGREETVDHLIFGTGWKVDLARYSFLDPALLRAIEQVGGYPRLGAGCECSVPGLHFLGAPSGWSFGPVARFVSGTFYSPRALVRQIRKSS